MNRPIEDQLRTYFTHVDRAQGAVEVPAIHGRSAPGQAVATERHDTDLEVFVLDQDLANNNTTTIGPDRKRRSWLLVAPAAAAAAIVALVWGLFVLTRNDAEPTVPANSTSGVTLPPPTTSTASTTPNVAADLPFPGGAAEPGRVATSQLGVDVAFDIPVPMSLTIGRENQLELFAFADPVERADLDRGFAMYRVAGLRTPAEASTPFGEASIDPLDIDRWITESGVVVLDDREIDVDNRAARVLDIQASPDALDVQPADCPPELRPCSFWAAFSGGVANPGAWISAQESVRLYIIPIGGHDPLAIMSIAQQSDDWDDFIESTVIATMEIGPDAPPAGTS